MDDGEAEKSRVVQSILTTHASAHSNYTMEVMDVFRLNKHQELDKVGLSAVFLRFDQRLRAVGT